MLRRLLVGGGIAGVLTVGIIVGSLTLGPVFAQSADTNPPAQATVQSVDDDAAEATVIGPDTDDIELEEQVGDQFELNDDADEAAAEGPDLDDLEEEVEEQNDVDVDEVEEQQPLTFF
jgi:hypothetical protein